MKLTRKIQFFKKFDQVSATRGSLGIVCALSMSTQSNVTAVKTMAIRLSSCRGSNCIGSCIYLFIICDYSTILLLIRFYISNLTLLVATLQSYNPVCCINRENDPSSFYCIKPVVQYPDVREWGHNHFFFKEYGNRAIKFMLYIYFYKIFTQ